MKKIKRIISLISSTALLTTSIGISPMGVSAAEDTDKNIALRPTYDIQLRYNNDRQDASGGTMEVRSNWIDGVLANDFLGIMRYEIPETPEGMHIAGAELKLVTERRKAGNTKFQIYKIDTGDKWVDEKINYSDLEAEIADARAGEALAEFIPAGRSGNAITDGFTDEEYLVLDSWTNTITIPASGLDVGEFDFIISRDPNVNNTSQTSFYTKDKTGDIAIGGSNATVTLTGEAIEQVYPELTISYVPDEQSTPEPTPEVTAEPTAEPTPEVTAEPTAKPTPEVTAEPTPEPTAESTPEPTDEPTPVPTAEPLPANAVIINGKPSNVTTKQTVTVDAYGNTRDAAYTTNNSSIWYIGTYDLAKIKKITMRLGLVGTAENMPQVKLAYMPAGDTVIDSDFIAANSGTIRSAKNTIGSISGLTEPADDTVNGHKYLGALYEIDENGVRISAEDTYSEFPGGTALLGTENISPLNVSAARGKVELFVYGTAQGRRAAIDYIIVTEKTEEELETPTPTETQAPIETLSPTETENPAAYPEGAIVVKDQPQSSNAGKQNIRLDANGTTREAAYTNGTAVWYLGEYDLANIASIDMRLGLVGQYKDGALVSKPQVNIAYMPLDGSTVDSEYITNNSSKIRSSKNLVATVAGLTEPSANTANGHQYLGALYTVTDTGISVDSAAYAAYPGGSASVDINDSKPINASAASGNVALFVYAVAGSRRATIDYVVVNEKKLTPTELRIQGEDTWVIRDNVEADYATNVDDYKAVIISDLGTEMKLQDVDILWSVSGSEYVSMKSVSGSNSAMQAEKELPIGVHEIILTAEYEDKNGIKLTASKTIKVEKRESSVPKELSIKGESEINLLTSELPYREKYELTVIDQFGAEMTDCVVNWTVDGDDTTGYSIENGELVVGEAASSAIITITASAVAAPEVKSSMNVSISISEYPSKLYPIADVLFRKNNEKQDNVTGADIEIKNLTDSDRGFSGGLKFNIKSLRESIEAGYPINSISIRLTTSISNDGSLVLKEFSNDWDESSYTVNSFDNKIDIINEAISADAITDVFTLNRMSRGKRIYDGELGDTETLQSWQTTVDITDYIKKWIENNPDKDEISLLLMANYNGTAANTIFAKDISSTWSNWNALTTKFPELLKTPEQLYPAIVIDYGEESVTISSPVDSLPIPAADEANTTKLSAVHYNPFTEQSDSEIIWSISKFTSEDGSELTEFAGVSIDADGTLSVTNRAVAGTVTIRAAAKSNKLAYAEKDITIEKLTTQLLNGSFENIDDAMMPLYWTSHDPAIDAEHNGAQGYQMNQASETMLANFLKNNDSDGYLSGTHSAEDPTGVYGKRTVKLTGAHGITKDYEGQVYTNNAANSGSDGGPDLRVTSGITYWVSQDYHLEAFYNLSDSAVVGPYVGYEGFQGTTGKSAQLSGSWYIKDGSPSTAYTTDGYDTLRKLITIPQNINRLRINWGLTGSEGSIYYHNFRLAPQGIDTAKTAVDGKYELKVTGAMDWTSDGIEVIPGKNYTYKFAAVSDASAAGKVVISFLDAEGKTIQSEEVTVEYSSAWQEKTGGLTAPENAAYATVKLANSTGTGSVWYDNIIFTETTASVPTYVSITVGNELAVAPVDGETANSYQYTARVTDQYNNFYDGAVVWSLDKAYTGITIRTNGALVIDSSAHAGTVVIRAASAENSAAYAEKKVTIVKKSTEGADVSLVNGAFGEYDKDTMLPTGWTNSDRIVSIANGSFDASITGWRLNYTSYVNSDTSATMEWDGTVDHTDNSGGSAKIFNANHAQGSMQISQNTAIEGGNTYNVSVWVKTDNVSSDSNVYATLIFYDENGTTIEENKQMLVFYPTGDTYGNNTTDWTKLSGSIYVNPLAVKMRVDMRYRGGANNNNGTVWFDDLVITKQAGMDADITYNGSPSLFLAGYGVEDGDVSRTYGEKWDSEIIRGISAGQQYVYSAQVQTFKASKGAYLMATYYDELGRVLSEEKTAYVSGTNDKWTLLQGHSTAPLNASYAVLSLCVDGKGKIWFADTSFEVNSELNAQSLVINGSDTVNIPSSNRYSVSVVDAKGITVDTLDIPMTAECPAGVSFNGETGMLEVLSTAAGNQTIRISAEYNGLTASKTVTTLSETTAMTLSGPASVVIPSNGSKTVNYSLNNQLGQSIDASAAAWNVSSKGSGVSIKNGVLTVAKGTTVQTVTITAEYNELKASIKVSLKNTNANTGSGGSTGGGGGGGGSLSGVVSNTSKPSNTSTSPEGMGNFVTSAGSAAADDKTEKINGEAIIPQPDPTYFVQGIDNIGGFSDIGSVSWAQKAIVAMSAVGIVTGKEDGKFAPNDNVTRAEFIKMLIGMLEYAKLIDTSDKSCDFTDVADDAWYHDVVAIAVNNGIVTGVSDTEFAPDANITRQDMAVMVQRAAAAANLSLPKGAEITFTDSAAISDYAASAVESMARAGIINGFDDGSFSPNSNATRAQAVVIIYRAAGGEN